MYEKGRLSSRFELMCDMLLYMWLLVLELDQLFNTRYPVSAWYQLISDHQYQFWRIPCRKTFEVCLVPRSMLAPSYYLVYLGGGDDVSKVLLSVVKPAGRHATVFLWVKMITYQTAYTRYHNQNIRSKTFELQ